MMSFLRKSTLVALAAAPVLLLSPTTANANQTIVAATTGEGTISPGLTLTPTFQTEVVFRAAIVVGVGSDGTTLTATNCTFRGASTIAETDLEGKGSGTLGGCVGANVTGDVKYERTGNVVTITGSITVNGQGHSVSVGVFVFVPTSVNPVTTYALAGSLALE